jgi:chemotaxis protein methyltransferase CheR
MAIRQDNFEFIRDRLYKFSAIILNDNKHYLVEARLSLLAKQNGMRNVDEFVDHLRLPAAAVLWNDVVDAMTTNETSFFRDITPFEVLRDNVFPALLETGRGSGRINVWSAASASGQEAYSIAMMWQECRNRWPNGEIEILATDISNSILARGRAASYSELEVMRGLSQERLERNFQREGDRWRINEKMRRTVVFRYLNLIESWPTFPKMDIIFIRNVLVYFDFPTKQKLFAKLRRNLKPNGFLFLGGAESVLTIDDQFERVFPSGGNCYRLKK